MIEAGHRAPSADNSQPWLFQWDGKRLTVVYDEQRASGNTFGPGEHATYLAMGAVKENILQMAGCLNTQIEETQPKKSRGYFQFECAFSGSGAQPANVPLFQRHTNRWPYQRTPIPAHICEGLQSLSQGNCRVLVFLAEDAISAIADCVRAASEARFQSRDVHEFLGRSLRFSPEEANRGDGLDVRTLPLPPGSKAFLRFIANWERMSFLNRFGGYKLLARMEAKAVSQGAAIVMIAGPDQPEDVIGAGMLMERAWIYLNSQGIAAHPYYVITDQLQRLKAGKISSPLTPMINKLASEIGALLNAGSATVHMLLRIGHPTRHPIRSLRLPPEAVTEVLQP
jgi:hypothetical protein